MYGYGGAWIQLKIVSDRSSIQVKQNKLGMKIIEKKVVI